MCLHGVLGEQYCSLSAGVQCKSSRSSRIITGRSAAPPGRPGACCLIDNSCRPLSENRVAFWSHRRFQRLGRDRAAAVETTPGLPKDPTLFGRFSRVTPGSEVEGRESLRPSAPRKLNAAQDDQSAQATSVPRESYGRRALRAENLTRGRWGWPRKDPTNWSKLSSCKRRFTRGGDHAAWIAGWCLTSWCSARQSATIRRLQRYAREHCVRRLSCFVKR
jgi:hypothetical protein